ncbi:MAG: amino acid adenylation domain-containing protein, partial [Acidobacteriota bacterium]
MNRKNLEAVYELTPMQQGMLFHSRYGGDAGVYLTQFHCDLHGDLEAGAFRQAWQTALDRHPVLRSSFHWQTKLDKPLQIVHRQLELPLESLDWRHLGAAEQEAQAADLLANDRERGFDLERAPLLRIVLLRLGERDYRLFWNHHHLLLDGWSVGLVLQEVFALYQAKVRGHALELPRPRPYKDFILWLKKQDRSAAEAYWRQLLAGFREPTVIELEPVGCPPESEYDRVFRDFKAPATAALEAAGRRERVTLNTLFQGAWALLLSRYAGRRDVVFGATTAGRPADLPGVEGMIGLFINTLPVRVALTEEPVADELRQLQAQQGQSRRYEWAPLADIRQWSDVAAGTPLFNSLVVFENLPLERKQDDATALAVGSAGFVQRTNYPLTLAISPRGKELSVRLAYATEHFDRTTIHRLLSELETLLLRFAATPTAPIDRLEVLTASERHQLLTEWNDSHREPLGDSTIHQLIAAQATRTPEAPAVRIGDREVSYRELVGRTRHLGQHLRGAGVEPEQIVAVCAESSLGALVALLAVLEAGGAYLPLDPAYPQERLDFMLADSGARLVLTHGDLSQRFRPSGVRTVTLDDTEAALTAGAPVEDRATSAATRPDHPVYLIYTSGSTGRPKGVMVEHRTLVARVRAMVELFELRPGHRQLQFVSLSFDVAGEEIFAPLACGATVVLSPEIRSLSPADMLAECGRLGVTKLNVPASHWHQMVDELEARDHRVPECLEILVTGAESPSPEKLSRWRRRASPASRLYNVYGPTEATILCSAQRFEMHSREPVGHRLPIGRRLANATLHVLDPTLWPVPVGTLGELGIGGYGLARGYHGRSAATAERFVPDPLSDTAGQRLYRTGDLVRHLPDGRLEFGGRVDHQVKLRGFRIELGEIEEALRRHPRIDDTAVLLREDRPGEQRLVAYIVVAGADEQRGNASAPLALSALRSHLAQHLPEFMVPAAFVFLDALPLTRNDKVDRRALPPPGSDRPDLETPYVPPSHAMERYLAEVWQDILGVERIGLHDGFFELGGDSLKGARFINRLEAELGEYVYVVALFDSPTVAGFGRYLSQHCPAAVEKRFGADSLTLTDEPQATADTASERIGEGDLRRVLELIEPLEPFTAEPSEPNPPAVFVLSPPRSGSTLLRVMLAGHPDLFAPPELDILSFNTLAERRDAFSGRYSFWLEGLLRAVMEIDDCDAEAARGTVEACEASGMSSKAFYRTLQERLEGRLLIDKTPAYALDLEVLRRAERDFEQTRFIHLLRHPCGMVNSFEKARIDELFFRYEHPYTPPQLGELMWNVCHRNILQFLQEIPPERQHRVRFEELVTHPDAVISGLCDFLGVEMQPRMLEPYSDPENRMTDGIHPLAKMLGDVKFHQHRAIDPRVAWRWQEIYDEDFLSESLSWPLAADLGYEKPELWQQAEPLPAPEPRRELTALETLPRNADGGGRFALSFGQQRLWVLDRLAPVGAGYNLPAAVKIRGRLVVAALAGSFADLVERHETLRCRFAAIDGTPPPDDAPTPPDEPGPHDAVQQIVEPPRLPDLALIDLSALSDQDRRAQTHRLAAAEARQPFDLARGPLLRIRLLAESADRHTLLVNLHHIVSDGWSQGVL